MRRAFLLLLGILVSAVVLIRAEAATVLALTIEELAEESDRVIRARVVSSSTERNEDLGLVFRLTTLEVLEDLRGEGSSKVVLRQLGGLTGEQGLWVEGDAVFSLGDEVVVFLSEGSPDGTLVHVVGLALGKFRVERGEDVVMATRRLEGLHLVRMGRRDRVLERSLPLDELRLRVRATSREAAGPLEGGGE